MSEKKRNLKQAKDAVAMAAKVLSYRRDLMPENDVISFSELLERAGELIITKEYDGTEFDSIEDKLEPLMQKYGGNVYPLKSITDYIETIVVAAVLALSVRSFFLTPFKIPTNSMYPSFYGMTAKVYDKGEDAPSFPKKVWNWAIKDSTNYTLEAPDSGDVLIELNAGGRYGNVGLFANRQVASKIVGIYPTYKKEYTFYVNNQPTSILVPADFSFDDLIAKAYPMGTNSKDLTDYARMLGSRSNKNIVEKGDRIFLNLGKITQGDYILNFDIVGGDMLFVDKFTYNFKKPQIGDPIVFLTKYCDGMTALNHGIPDDKYYIKRLVGLEGDTLEIKDFTLYRNNEPISGDPSFALNFAQNGEYSGYRNEEQLAIGKSVLIPQNMAYALGDNSANSLDSRYWGFVPQKAIIGKSLFKFYPFIR
ncbi:MAG: signal peptidase I [Opitutales bacterium]